MREKEDDCLGMDCAMRAKERAKPEQYDMAVISTFV